MLRRPLLRRPRTPPPLPHTYASSPLVCLTQAMAWVTHASTVYEKMLSQYWNEATPPHSSMWPELCCAVQCPWYMLGRVYMKLGLPSPILFTFAMAIVSFFSINTYRLQKSDGPAIIALTLLAAVTIILVTVWLRMRVRSQAGIPGSLRWDFCAVVPWMCALPCQGYPAELAAMDRQLSPTFSDTQSTNFAPRNKWSTGLFECGLCTLTGTLPQFCCAANFPFFVQIRLLYRLGKGSLLSVISLAALQVLLPAILLIIALATESITLIIVSCLLYFYAVGLVVLVWLRSSVRERYHIVGTLPDDFLHVRQRVNDTIFFRHHLTPPCPFPPHSLHIFDRLPSAGGVHSRNWSAKHVLPYQHRPTVAPKMKCCCYINRCQWGSYLQISRQLYEKTVHLISPRSRQRPLELKTSEENLVRVRAGPILEGFFKLSPDKIYLTVLRLKIKQGLHLTIV